MRVCGVTFPFQQQQQNDDIKDVNNTHTYKKGNATLPEEREELSNGQRDFTRHTHPTLKLKLKHEASQLSSNEEVEIVREKETTFIVVSSPSPCVRDGGGGGVAQWVGFLCCDIARVYTFKGSSMWRAA
jgi:hypothetical protein